MIKNAFVLLLMFATGVMADLRWNLTTADFTTKQVNLQSLDESTVRFNDGADRTLPVQQFIAAESPPQQPRSPQGKFRLTLTGGASVTGEPVEVKGENLTFASALLGEMTLPLRQISRLESIVRAPHARKTDASPTEDIVLLANGDSVRGFVQQVTPTAVVVKGDAGPTDVPADAIAVVIFAATTTPPDNTDRAFRIRMEDGSWLTVESLSLAGSTVTVRFAGADRKVDIAHLLAIEQVNGPVSWLSSRKPTETVVTPFLDTTWPPRMDRSVTGEPIRFGQQTYAHGIGVHSATKLTWNLAGAYKHFRTQYAIDGRLPSADVDVRILLDGKVVHEVKGFRAAVLSPVVSLDVSAAKTLTLEVDFGAGLDVQDRFNWIEPALLRNAPPTTQSSE